MNRKHKDRITSHKSDVRLNRRCMLPNHCLSLGHEINYEGTIYFKSSHLSLIILSVKQKIHRFLKVLCANCQSSTIYAKE